MQSTEKAQNKTKVEAHPHIVFTLKEVQSDRVLGSSILFITITLVIWMKTESVCGWQTVWV